MAYTAVSKKTGDTYYLHMKVVTLRGGRQQTIYYFARKQSDNAVELPAGYEVMENSRTGLPMLRKSK